MVQPAEKGGSLDLLQKTSLENIITLITESQAYGSEGDVIDTLKQSRDSIGDMIQELKETKPLPEDAIRKLEGIKHDFEEALEALQSGNTDKAEKDLSKAFFEIGVAVNGKVK